MTRKADIKLTDYAFAGEDLVLQYTVYDGNGAGASAVDITGYAITFTMVDSVTNPSETVTYTVGSGITLTDAANGVLQVAIADTDTSGLTEGTKQYALKRTDAGSENVLDFGSFYLHVGAIT